ncbi:hypothetical protein NAEGRDRAFT_77721 [Naegleria gruberi]|uniref:Uncharacterized protein n=1 Tax=Naegleria gruberi TaxID=5762 RepID=D2UXW6_NAEGR|nr:uncharacterized protein NAEGRDRAFT_77721 [Naegleria gruberi]EFC50699.1 hypothetical protein NAEGRDRAFT_77721 [Naegleria gruberi]|eukprot:XP_002683443.1 hypothetical protein NAEGRDRAFT_77721 [Naegleria gruberi strain NEG-M]
MNQNNCQQQQHQQTLTSMLLEAVKAASSSKQMHSNHNTNSINSPIPTNNSLQSFSFTPMTSSQQNTTMMMNNNINTTLPNNNNTTINSNNCIGERSATMNTCDNGVVMDSNLVMQMMRMMMSNDPLLNNTQQPIINSTSTTNLSQVNDNLDSTQMLTMLMNNTMNNSTMSQLNQIFSNFLLNNSVQDSISSNTTNSINTDKKLSCSTTSMSPTFDQLVNSPQFFDNGCSTHIFIKKGNTKRKSSTFEQNWYRLLIQHQFSPNTTNGQEESKFTNSHHHTKIVHTNKCLISTDCFYYLLIVLPSKLYSLADLEFQLEEDCSEGKKKKKKTTNSPTSPPIEIKIRGKDITTSTKLKHSIQSPNCSSSSNSDNNVNSIAVFEIMVNRKRAKTKADSSYNIHVNCKQERLLKMSIDLNENGKSNDPTLCNDEEMLDLAQHSEELHSQKKRKKESLLFGNDDEQESDLQDDSDTTRKRSKSNVTKSNQESAFDLLKQWIIVTVFHDSLNVDLSKFPNFAFPKELSLNETFLLYVDVPTQLSEYHDICFKILDAESKQELSFNGEKWIDTNVVNCCNFNIQASLVSLHVEYSISFRDINHDKPLVFVVALKDKNTEEERIIYNGSPFKIQKQLDSIDELGISTIQCSGFETLVIEPTTISEIFDEIPILNGDSLFSEMGSPTLSTFVPPSESDIMDDFERFLDM